MIIGTSEVLDNIDKTTILFFSAPRCAPCKKLKPQLELLNLKYKENNNIYNIDIIYVNVYNVEHEIINKLDISCIPTLYIYNPSKKVDPTNKYQNSDINNVKEFFKKEGIVIENKLQLDDNF